MCFATSWNKKTLISWYDIVVLLPGWLVDWLGRHHACGRKQQQWVYLPAWGSNWFVGECSMGEKIEWKLFCVANQPRHGKLYLLKSNLRKSKSEPKLLNPTTQVSSLSFCPLLSDVQSPTEVYDHVLPPSRFDKWGPSQLQNITLIKGHLLKNWIVYDTIVWPLKGGRR